MGNAPSRIERARRRAEGAKRALAIASAVAFLMGLLLVRTSHPGKAATKASSASSTTSRSSAASTDSGSLNLGTGSIAPAAGTSTPQAPVQVQTHVS